MRIFTTLSIAARALAKNKMRAFLTVLGVVIGIAAVTTMVSIGQSSQAYLLNELSSMGTNVLMIFPRDLERDGVSGGRSHALTADDSDSIAAECSGVLASSPIVFTSGQLVYSHNNIRPDSVLGVGEQFEVVRNWKVDDGVFFDRAQVDRAEKVCVIGRTIASRLLQAVNPIGKVIRINDKPFTVIGLLKKKGASMTGQDQDNIVLLPYTTVRRTLEGSAFDDVHEIMVSAKDGKSTDRVKAEVTGLLRDRHGIYGSRKSDFQIETMAEIANMLGTVTNTMTLMLAAIAGISLLVGGVGIMNIMLVSVTERTREIGIRMAVGAKGRDILFQFLIESVLLSCIGGAIGIALGIGASFGLTQLINSALSGPEWPTVVSIPAAVIAFLFAAAVGIFFGFYPARRASMLDPIDALRYE